MTRAGPVRLTGPVTSRDSRATFISAQKLHSFVPPRPGEGLDPSNHGQANIERWAARSAPAPASAPAPRAIIA